MTAEKKALGILRAIASDEVVSKAEQAVAAGTHAWVQDPAFEAIGLVATGTNEAVVVVYPAGVYGDRADFEVNDEWVEGR